MENGRNFINNGNSALIKINKATNKNLKRRCSKQIKVEVGFSSKLKQKKNKLYNHKIHQMQVAKLR